MMAGHDIRNSPGALTGTKPVSRRAQRAQRGRLLTSPGVTPRRSRGDGPRVLVPAASGRLDLRAHFVQTSERRMLPAELRGHVWGDGIPLGGRGRVASASPRGRCCRGLFGSVVIDHMKASRIRRARASRRAATLSTVTRRPSRTIATRPQARCTSGNTWLDNSTVRPSAAASSISSKNVSCTRGSSPSVGSSRTTSCGSCCSACTRPSFCFMPREYPPTGEPGPSSTSRAA